ncbi:MAG TPA: Ig-like domain-containing protein, partial [Candidatus Acidoferrum sp.]|nr:Ig-like domain-containing protein [Candidatus Acidoferrum sp.]
MTEDKAGNRGTSPASFNWTVDAVPPTTSITSAIDGNRSTVTAGGNTTSTSMTFAFSGTDRGVGVNHFECSLDGASFAICVSPVEYSNLADGAHTLEVRAEDNVVNVDASPASFAWTIDTISPTTSIDSVVDNNKNTLSNGSSTRSNSITFTFSGSDTSKVNASKVEVKRFECSIDNSDFTDCASPLTFPNLLSNGPHTFKVRAVDNSGNNDNSPELFTWYVDATPPDATINKANDGNNETVTNGGNTTSTSMTFNFSGSDIGVGLDHFECSLDGASFVTCTSPVQFNNISEGSHTLEVRGVDKAGNEGPTPIAFIWTVNTKPPNTTINSVIDGNKNIVTNNSDSRSNIVTIVFSAMDVVTNVDHFECNIDNSDFVTCTSPFTFPNLLSDGPHTFKVSAVDNSGHKDPSPALYTWTVDTAAPTTNITSATDGNKSAITNGGSTRSSSMTFTFSGNDIGGAEIDHIECSIDGASFSACDTPLQFTNLTIGAHTFEVRAEDKVGNEGQMPTAFLWTITSLPPPPTPPPSTQNITTPPPSIPQNITTSRSVGGNQNIVTNESTQIPTAVQPPDTKIVSATDGDGNAVTNDAVTPLNSITFVLSASIAGIQEGGQAGIGNFECSIDGSSFSSCTSPVQFNNLADGAHILEARSEDNSGNKDPSPASFTWTVDTVPPDTRINSAIDGNN